MNQFPRRTDGEFRNEFAWSVTRRKNFRECRRRYYYSHYAHWGGWRRDADERARRCYALGKMTTLPMWAGQIVHETIEQTLRPLRDEWPRRNRPDPERLRTIARERLRSGWKQSRDQLWKADPKRNINLFEHYFRIDLPRDRTDETGNLVYHCLDRFAESRLLDKILGIDPLDWLSVEDFERFNLGDFQLVVRLDLALRDRRNILVIDWKTGRESSADVDQVATYALAASQLWSVAVEDVRLMLVYLGADKLDESTVTAEQAIETREQIYLSCHEMASLLVDGDIDRNEPLPESEFERTANERTCARCPYQEFCFPADALPVHNPPAAPTES